MAESVLVSHMKNGRIMRLGTLIFLCMTLVSTLSLAATSPGPPLTVLPDAPQVSIGGGGSSWASIQTPSYVEAAAGGDFSSAFSAEDLYFMISGPQDQDVPVSIDTFLSTYKFFVNGTGDFTNAANVYASAALYFTGLTTVPVAGTWSMIDDSGIYANTATEVMIHPNYVYYFSLVASVNTYGSSSAIAYADPTVTIDPTFAAMGYSLDLGNGFSNISENSLPIPEPASMWMSLAGLLTVFLAFSRKRNRNS